MAHGVGWGVRAPWALNVREWCALSLNARALAALAMTTLLLITAPPVRAHGAPGPAEAAVAEAAAEPPWAAPRAQGLALMARGNDDAAWPLLQHAAALAQEALGPHHPQVWALRNALGAAYTRAGRFPEAEDTFGTLLLQQRQAGADEAAVGATLSHLGALYTRQGRYRDAEVHHLEALERLQQALGAEHLDLSRAHNNLGALYRQMGRLPQAEVHLQRSLQLRERGLGEGHVDVGTARVNLGNLYRDMGMLDRAEALHHSALTVLEARLGPRHPMVATARNNLALVRVDAGDHEGARPLLESSLAARREALGATHPEVAKSFGNLARTQAALGDEAGALLLLLQALAIQQQHFTAPHRDVAQTLREIADLKARHGEGTQARALYERSARMLEAAFEEGHPELAVVLARLAHLAWGEGETAEAAALLTRAADIEEHHLEAMLTVGAEMQRRAYADTMRASTDLMVERAVQAGAAHPVLSRLAAQTVLRRKGRVLEAMSHTTRAWTQRLAPQDRPLLDELTELRTRRAAWLASAPPAAGEAHRIQGRVLRERQAALEAQLSRRVAPEALKPPDVTLQAVQAALPRDAALLEWVIYTPRPAPAPADRADQAARRYAAFVLQPAGDPAWVDLGDAQVIDAAIAATRRALADPTDTGWRGPARRLDALVFAPLRQRLPRDVRTLLLAPDGPLNLVPFAVLHQRAPLALQQYRLTYLASGRDVRRWASQTPVDTSSNTRLDPKRHTTPGVIFAAPDFDAPGSAASEATAPAWRPFPELPGTRQEAADVQRLLAGSRVISGRAATTEALMSLRGPGVLHIATHGYAAAPAPEPGAPGRPAPPSAAQQADAAMLAAGLALAGANRPAEGRTGLLSALELAGLDLWGTRLVVLSACDSGLGLPWPGEGVFGLRHALGLAGSQSQVMSLWKVDDEATRQLMHRFYLALRRGLGPAQALRQVQLHLRQRPAPYSHPFYWAGFVAAGADAPLPVHLFVPADGHR